MHWWREEKILLASEIVWTRLYFDYQASQWRDRLTGAKDGKDCYARKQMIFWETLSAHARSAKRQMETITA